MHNKFIQPDRIDRYIFHDMEEQERVDFEKEMQHNESLREEVELMRQVNVSFERKGEQKALRALKNIASEEELENVLFSRPNIHFRKYLIRTLSVAACILFLVFYGLSPKYASQQLFSDYFDSEVFEIIPGRGGVSPVEQKNETLFSNALELLETGEITTAIHSLTYLSSIPDFEYKEEAEWLLALAHLKQSNRQDAIEILSNVIENDSFYTPQAMELMKKIKRRRWF